MMCKCRFINCNKRDTQVRDVDNGGGCACGGQGVYGKNPLNFVVNLKLLLKKKKKRKVMRTEWELHLELL